MYKRFWMKWKIIGYVRFGGVIKRKIEFVSEGLKITTLRII